MAAYVFLFLINHPHTTISGLSKGLSRRLLFSSPVRSTRRAIVVTPVVRVHVLVPVTLRQSFICKFFKSSYLHCHSSESIHFWTIGTLEGRLSFHDSWPQGWCPGVGLEVKVQDTFKKCFSTFLLWKQLRQIVCRTSVSLVTLTYRSWSEGHHDLYLTVQWFCLISWRLFDIWTPYFRIMSQYDTKFDLKINVGHCDLYFMVHWLCLTSWRQFDVWTSFFRIMSQYDPTFDLKINVGHCDLYFMVQWFCLISWRLFDIGTPYFGIISQYDPMFDLKINVGHCDLYFMVQWFCLISWRLFDVWTSYFRIMSQYDLTVDLKINVANFDL